MKIKVVGAVEERREKKKRSYETVRNNKLHAHYNQFGLLFAIERK
jgi:hypothetical protein